MKRVFSIIAAAGLLWGLGLTGAAVADEKPDLTCEQAQALVDKNRAEHDAKLFEARDKDAEAKAAEQAAADARDARDAARDAAAAAITERDEARAAAATAREERDKARDRAEGARQARDDARASGNEALANRDAARQETADDVDHDGDGAVGTVGGKTDDEWQQIADDRFAQAAQKDQFAAEQQQAADEFDAEATRQQQIAEEADAEATKQQNIAAEKDALATQKEEEAEAARKAAKEARDRVDELDKALPGLIEQRDEACPGAEPTAVIDGANCEAGGVNVKLDNSKLEEDTTFTVTSAFGEKVEEQSVTVPAGETKTVVAKAPTDVEGTITVAANDKVLAEETGTLICDDASPAPTKPPAAPVEQKGEQLPFTGSSTGLIVLVAAGLLTAGGATLGGLRLFRARG